MDITNFKSTLPPRKRAKTKEEKEQRRIERILRNRRAAHASREKKRKHAEFLETYVVKLESYICEFQKNNTEMAGLLANNQVEFNPKLVVDLDLKSFKNDLLVDFEDNVDSDNNDESGNESGNRSESISSDNVEIKIETLVEEDEFKRTVSPSLISFEDGNSGYDLSNDLNNELDTNHLKLESNGNDNFYLSPISVQSPQSPLLSNDYSLDGKSEFNSLLSDYNILQNSEVIFNTGSFAAGILVT